MVWVSERCIWGCALGCGECPVQRDAFGAVHCISQPVRLKGRTGCALGCGECPVQRDAFGAVHTGVGLSGTERCI